MVSSFTLFTVGGAAIDPRNFDVSLIDIEDIAHSLSQICRYGGHTRSFYSVAEHSVILSHAVPEHLERLALLHDASEAIVGDVARPLKDLVPQFRDFEEDIIEKIMRRFGVEASAELWAEFKRYDVAVSIDEMTALMPEVDPYLLANYQPLGVKVYGLHPVLAKAAFLDRFQELFID